MQDLKHYLSLATMLSIAVGLFWYFNYLRTVQLGIVVITAAAYVCWGIIHHTIKKDLNWEIVVEYTAVALIAAVTLVFLLWRS